VYLVSLFCCSGFWSVIGRVVECAAGYGSVLVLCLCGGE
jgi:hypothetical protein